MSNQEATALQIAMQDQDAERLAKLSPANFRAIERAVGNDDLTPENAERFVEVMLGFNKSSALGRMCLSAVKVLYRKHQEGQS